MRKPRDEQAITAQRETVDPDTTAKFSGWPDQVTALRRRPCAEEGAKPSEYALVVYAGNQLGRVFPLMPGVNMIGRAANVDLALTDDEVSRNHAWIILSEQAGSFQIILEDKGSTNGTFLNDQVLSGPVRLTAGDRIAVGNHVLKLVAMDPLEREFYAVLLDQSTRDPLTGLHNRRSTLEELQNWCDLSRRHQRPLAVIMCDLDKFKQINDSLGHGTGDLILEEFGRRVKDNLRTTDFAGRIGGDEFLIILSETEMEGARFLAERLRSAISSHPFLFAGQELRLTCSLGLAQRTNLDRDGGALMARADSALYAAKHGGRDRVVADSPH